MKPQLSVSSPDDAPRHRYFTASHYLAVLILFLIAAPFVEEFGYSSLVEGILLSIVLLSALPAAGDSRRTFIIGLLLVIPALAMAWISRGIPGTAPRIIETFAALTFVAFVIVQLLRFILTAKRVSKDVLSAAMAGYLTLGIFFSFAYILLAEYKPHAFAFTLEAIPEKEMRRFQAIYFSFVTLTTTGYGDIVPVSNVARMLAMVESICGTFYLTVLIARLVSLYSTNPPIEAKSSVES